MTSIIPKRNVFLPGVNAQAKTLRRRDAGRRIGSPDGSSGLIMAEVIAWPWAADEIGVPFPSGIVGIRTNSPGRATEIANDTAGTDEGWIAVPGTLPVGYTARRQRDHNRGPLGITRRRGNAYIVCAANSPGGDTFGSYFDPYFSVNGLNPVDFGTTTSPVMPSYRGTNGTSTIKVPWVPMNVSQKTINGNCNIGEPTPGTNGLPDTLNTLDPSTFPSQISGVPALSYLVSGVTETQGRLVVAGSGYISAHVGWRNIRLRMGLTSATMSVSPTGTTYCRFLISRMADGSNNFTTYWGDVIDYDSGWVGASSLTHTGPLSPVWYQDIDAGALLPPGKTPVWYQVAMFGYECFFGTAYSLIPAGRNGLFSTDRQYETGFMCSPRVDVPAWFTATGPGLLAPGGV